MTGGTAICIRVLLAVSLAAPSCFAADAGVEAHRAQWRAAGLSSYEYGYRKYCECHPDTPPETIVTVRDGVVVDVRHRPVGYPEEVPAERRNLRYYWTMDELFSLLDTAFERGAEVRVSYDLTMGYPAEIYIDYDAGLIGDEVDLRLTHVQAVDP